VPVIRSKVRTEGTAFDANLATYAKARELVAAARAASIVGGTEKSRELHTSRKKLMPRERIAALLDVGSPFLEVGQLAGYELYEDAVPSGAMVTGIGMVARRPCMIMANDATVKGGTYYPITLKKQVRAQAIARENGLPCIYLVDSGGAFLPMQDELFPDEQHFGRIFRNITEMSAMGLKQVAAVMGSCTAGGAYIPALCDESIIEKENGTIFLGGPQLVQAATGEIVDAETLGGADVHTRLSGVADHLAEDDLHAISIIRDIMARPGGQVIAPPLLTPRPPAHDPREIAGLIPANPKEPIPAMEILARLLDASEFVPYRERFGTTLICGTGAIGGYPIGVLINDGVLFSESAQKAANFIELCTQTDTPLLFLHNISGFMVGKEYEQGGIAKHGAKMVNAVTTTRVPKFSIVIGGSHGAGNLAMCGRSFGPRLMAMWPNARASLMGGEQAATVLALVREQQLARTGKIFSPEEAEAFKRPIREQYDRQGRPVYYGSRMWIDSVVDPVDTRDWLTLGLALAAASPKEETRFGVFRM
jgi:3-methylcrotonyl-CoA carboxylase beta subunit